MLSSLLITYHPTWRQSLPAYLAHSEWDVINPILEPCPWPIPAPKVEIMSILAPLTRTMQKLHEPCDLLDDRKWATWKLSKYWELCSSSSLWPCIFSICKAQFTLLGGALLYVLLLSMWDRYLRPHIIEIGPQNKETKVNLACHCRRCISANSIATYAIQRRTAYERVAVP